MTVHSQRSQVVILDYQDASSRAHAAFSNALECSVYWMSKLAWSIAKSAILAGSISRDRKGGQVDGVLAAKLEISIFDVAASTIQDVRGMVAGVQQIMAEKSAAQS